MIGVEACVCHAERVKDALPKQFAVLLAADLFDDRSENFVIRIAVVEPAARLEFQRLVAEEGEFLGRGARAHAPYRKLLHLSEAGDAGGVSEELRQRNLFPGFGRLGKIGADRIGDFEFAVLLQEENERRSELFG